MFSIKKFNCTASAQPLASSETVVGFPAGKDNGLLGWTVVDSAGSAVLGSWLMVAKLKGRQVKVIIGVGLLVIAANMLRGLL